MIAFITTIRHPQNSADYARVEDLLEATLASVTAQTDERFIVIVVGNQEPSFELPERVHFVRVDFPAPAPADGPRTARAPFVWDKGTKVAAGLIYAKQFDPTHVMLFDADDFVHRSLTEWVLSDQDSLAVTVMQRGLMYSSSRNCYKPVSDFHRACGTSFVVPYRHYGVPESVGSGLSQQQLAEIFGERLWRIMGAHRDADQWYLSQGVKLRGLDRPAAVYHVDTGENHSGKSMRGVAWPGTGRLFRDYGVVPTMGPLLSLWSAIGPRAFSQSVYGVLVRATKQLLSKLRPNEPGSSF